MDYEFLVQSIEDGACVFSKRYGSAIEAVRVYQSFKDFGFAKYQREIVLVEPDGQVHSKTFTGPMWKELMANKS